MKIRQFTVKTYMPSVPFLGQVNKIKPLKSNPSSTIFRPLLVESSVVVIFYMIFLIRYAVIINY